MVDSINNTDGRFYSISQGNNYDNSLKSNVFTTQFKIGDINLSNLNDKDRQELQNRILDLAKELNNEMSTVNTNLIFDYEDSISSLVLTIKQKDSGQIIRKIPTDESLELMKQMRDIVSVILDTKG